MSEQDWEVSADGYRLIIEGGAIVGLAYDEWPWPWGDVRYAIYEWIAETGIGRIPGQPHMCSAACRCPVHGTPMIYAAYWDDHACQDVNCMYGHGVRVAMTAKG